ncbi:hypothetical protein B6U99_07475 [Candidatus Geothermarchaeota archaeon ex4572_27]|nr:MAG: hypothetical protein B6U99_07475 [Candidatus Geothermarchaeota archaeon ex4572_27]
MGLGGVVTTCLVAVAVVMAASLAVPALVDVASRGLNWPRGVAVDVYSRIHERLHYAAALREVRLDLVGGRHVRKVEVKLVNDGSEPWPLSSVRLFDVIVRYVTDDGAIVAKWLPYEPSGGLSSGWSVESSNELLNPINVALDSGAWDPGEELTIVVRFSPLERPYYDVDEGEGFLTVVVQPTHHEGLMVNLVPPVVEVSLG